MLASGIRAVVACPQCHHVLEIHDAGATCPACGTSYENVAGILDLRPRSPFPRSLEYVIGEPFDPPPPELFGPLREQTGSRFPGEDIVLDSLVAYGNRMTREFLSYFPMAGPDGGRMLDLGSGQGEIGAIAKRTGYDYVAMDIGGDQVDVLGDAHAIPFVDEAFDFVLAVSVLEHLRYPHVAVREIRRVLRPGGRFIGTVAFLEPFHMDSYYHHTHLAVHDLLAFGGLDVVVIAPSEQWAAVRPIAEMSLFKGAPRVRAVGRVAAWPLDMLSRAWWRLQARRGRATELQRRLEVAGGFRFVADAPTPRP